MVFLVGISGMSVLMRYVFPSVQLAYLDILLPDLYVWLALVAASAGIRQSSHLGLTLLPDYAPPRAKAILNWFYVICGVCFFTVLLWSGLMLTKAQMVRGTMAPFGYPSWIVTAALPVAAVNALVSFIGVARRISSTEPGRSK